MLTRLGYYADKLLEAGWLAAAVVVPLFFNVYSSRVFEPDKIAVLRSLVLVMTVIWLVKVVEGGWRAVRQSGAPTRTGRLNEGVTAVADSTMPSWLGFLSIPMIVPVLVYALAYLISSIFTMTPDATWWGSYQRLQGTYSQYSYIMLGLIVLFNMRTRVQLERLISFMILTSAPVALYGLLQANRLDPLPWAGDTATRVASTMGNAIFVAAWLIMAVPFTLYRFVHGISLWATARASRQETTENGDGHRRPYRKSSRAVDAPDYGWAVVANGAGVILIPLLIFGFVLKLIAGLPLPDAQLWPALPVALVIFYFSCWAIEWLGSRRDDPVLAGTGLWITGIVLFFAAFLAFVPNWKIGAQNTGIEFSFDWVGFLWVMFFMLAWGAIAATAYALGNQDMASSDSNRGVVRMALNVGYGLLLVIQLTCIYLTQSRGPWLGLGVGLVAFAAALWLVGRSRGVRWMNRIGGTASAIVLVGAIFVGLLNIPGSPLQSLDHLPVIGTGISRLSTLTRTEDGTGKVRTLIWQGATALITSDPVRTIIGYGPESMYVVYNKFYPPDLAHWELRNATPDRSHNVEFDHMVTMGLMGLLAYYFMVGSFLFFGIRIIKRATNTRDQLLAITLVAAMAAHFVEIQTGIQIAATWTYFYLMVGAMVAFGYYMTNYLRPAAVPAEQSTASERERAAEEVRAAQPVAVGSAASRQTVAAASASDSQKSTVTASTGNGRPSAAPANVQNGKPRSKSQQGSRDGGSQGTSQGRYVQGQPSRRQSPVQPRVVVPPASERWTVNTIWPIVYAALLIAAIVFIFKVNVATVAADTLYKQGQAYDQAQQWSGSITKYQAAIDLQPNQDYYYLFLGRAYLEWAKITDQDMSGNDPSTGKPYTQQRKDAERLARLQAAETQLKRARDLNPLNTDHYANLGRLYLYWSDPSGGNDPSKTALGAQYMEKAVENSPGNAQLWDELAVAHARNGQFAQAMQDLDHSASAVDSTYQRTPFIKGQLLQERATNIKSALIAGAPLPTGGETDYGKLVIEAGKAFSDSIAIDPSYFVDNGMQDRVEFFLSAGTPFTNTNTTVDKVQLTNVLTDTIIAAYNQQMPANEKALADLMRSKGMYTGTDNKVPSQVLQQLWNDPRWAGVPEGQTNKAWLDPDVKTVSARDVVPYSAMGFISYRLGSVQAAVDSYQRAVDIDPSNYYNQKNLGSLLSQQQLCSQAQQHLQTALQIVQNMPDVQTDQQRQSDLQNIQGELQRVQSLTNCK